MSPSDVAAAAAVPWGTLELRDGDTRSLDLGTLRLVVRRRAEEVWVQTQRSPHLSDPDEGDWHRWSAAPDTKVAVRAAMPDRLLVVSHEHSYHLPPKREAKVYVRIPLFVQVALEARGSEQVLIDLPSVVLSHTWWGSFAEGELGYWLTTKARAALTDDLFLPHFGVCPLHLENESGGALPVQRFALQVAHLSLFCDGRKTWTDEVRVRYEGSMEGSEIRFGEEPPEEADGAELLAGPRVPAARGLHVRTVDRLRHLSARGF
ncbi:MAG TPA: DUF432 domain-containing protein [Longimicrobiales bacterium]|nr:DUF432 domain-containing protein [Longimicrobiales bacterium]